MKMVDELKHLFLYSANNKIYLPVEDVDRKKNSAILLLTPDIKSTIDMMKLQYLHNPNLYTGLYIDRNVSAFVGYADSSDIEDFDEVEEESISESTNNANSIKIKFNIDEDRATMVDRSYMLDVFNVKNAKKFIKDLNLFDIHLSKNIKINVYPSISSIKEYIPNIIKSSYNNNLYSYSDEKGIHVLSFICYDQDNMHGDYITYLTTEMYNYLIRLCNNKIAYEISRGIAIYSSGLMKKIILGNISKSISITSNEINIASICSKLGDNDAMSIISEYIKTGNYVTFSKSVIAKILSNKKKDDHIKYVASKNIPTEKPVKESFIDSDYEDIIKICDSLPKNELDRITFYDTYRNSPYVIKRIIHRDGLEPVGFLDVYQFPSKPDIAQIVIAVHSNHRGEGISKDMVKELLADEELYKRCRFTKYYWTAHTYNKTSQNLAISCGFNNTGEIDKYGRMIFIKNIEGEDDAAITEGAPLSSANSNKLRQYLYKERLKNNRDIMPLYDMVKSNVYFIRKTYPNIKMYKRLNIFVDLSYYHGLFLKNNKYKLDKAVNFYFSFLNKLIDNQEINSEYKNRTIFIPVDKKVWGGNSSTDITDFRSNLNPISIICRLIRTNPEQLRNAWGNKTVVFLGSRGYFTVNFSRFNMQELPRFKTNIRKLTSINEPIVDDIEVYDSMEVNPIKLASSQRNIDSKKVMVSNIIDKIEANTSIKIDDISKIDDTLKDEVGEISHLKIVNSIGFPKQGYDTGELAIVWINSDTDINKKEFDKAPIIKDKFIKNYCIIK